MEQPNEDNVYYVPVAMVPGHVDIFEVLEMQKDSRIPVEQLHPFYQMLLEYKANVELMFQSQPHLIPGGPATVKTLLRPFMWEQDSAFLIADALLRDYQACITPSISFRSQTQKFKIFAPSYELALAKLHAVGFTTLEMLRRFLDDVDSPTLMLHGPPSPAAISALEVLGYDIRAEDVTSTSNVTLVEVTALISDLQSIYASLLNFLDPEPVPVPVNGTMALSTEAQAIRQVSRLKRTILTKLKASMQTMLDAFGTAGTIASVPLNRLLVENSILLLGGLLAVPPFLELLLLHRTIGAQLDGMQDEYHARTDKLVSGASALVLHSATDKWLQFADAAQSFTFNCIKVNAITQDTLELFADAYRGEFNCLVGTIEL